MRLAALLYSSLLLAAVAAAQPPSDMSDQTFDNEMAWMEIQAALPEFPREEDLVRIKGNFGAREYFVDGASLKVDPDGVVRFTMIIDADGVKNTIYEGVRCETKEHKVYSVGRNNGTWGKVQKQQWQRITNRGMLGYHDMLYTDFFCPNRVIVGSKDEALNALKRGAHPDVQRPR